MKLKKKNIQHLIPFKKLILEKKKIKFTRAYIVVNHKNEILINRRKSKGMLASMLEIPNDEWVDAKKKLKRHDIYKNLSAKYKRIGKITYSFSHFDLDIAIYRSKVMKKNYKNFNWIKSHKIDTSGMPTVMKEIVKKSINIE